MFKSRTATILAATALVVAVFGSTPLGAAGSLILARNSVGTAQLKKNAVTAAKIRKNAVTGVKVKNGTLLAADFKAGQLPAGPQGPKGDPGPQGTSGAVGPKGDSGAPGTAVAYARVVATDNGVAVDESRSKGVSQANVTQPAIGITCFEGLAFAPKVAVATADVGLPGSHQRVVVGVALMPSVNLANACGGGAQAAVITTQDGFNVYAPYYVIFE